MKRVWHFLKNVMGIVFRHPITGTSIIAKLSDGRIVMLRRRDNGLWSLPGGIVDWGEDIPTGVARELREETGLVVTAVNRLVGVYSDFDRDPRMHSICVVVEVEAEGSMGGWDPLEVVEVQAFYPGAMPMGNLSHDHDRQLQDYFNGLTTLA